MTQDLLIQFKNGDKKAFDKLINLYKKRLFNYIYRFTNINEDSEDLLQELFIKIYKAHSSYIHEGKFDNYIFKIASNLCKDYYKKNKFNLQFDENDYNFNANAVLNSDSLEKSESEKIIRDAVSHLPYKQRTALNLIIFEEKSYSETSQITGFSIKSVKSLMFRARKNLKTGCFYIAEHRDVRER